MILRSDLALANAALQEAQKEFEAFCSLPPDLEKLRAWKNFVIAFNRIWTCLSAIKNGGSTTGDMIAKRKSDELLTYLYQSRHHIEHIPEIRPANITLEVERMIPVDVKSKVGIISITVEDNYGRSSKVLPQRPMHIIGKHKFVLGAVTNEGKEYPRPTKHLDQDISEVPDDELGQLAIKFIEKALKDASDKLVQVARRHSGLPPL